MAPLDVRSGAEADRCSARKAISAFALHRFVREPFELDHKWMTHLTLRHDQAGGIRFRRNPPLGAHTSVPEELASRILMVEHGRLQDQPASEPVSPALNIPRVFMRKLTPLTVAAI
jgi:hypothetical protein